MHPADETPCANEPRGERRVKGAPERVHYCRKGHRMNHVCPSGKYVCYVCNRRRQRLKYEAVRQQRLKDRRRRIAARRRPSRTERIWAAGHFEGEGTFSIARRGHPSGPVPIVSLTSTDKCMVDVFHAHWPGYMQAVQPNNPRARLQYTWTLLNHDRIEGFILDTRPYLKSARMRAKARLLLEDVRARAELRRTPKERAEKAERHLKMRALNRRGVPAPGEVDSGRG